MAQIELPSDERQAVELGLDQRKAHADSAALLPGRPAHR